MELEVQQWVDEALRNAARATERILDRVASMGVRRPDQDCGEASDCDLADSKAAQVVMRAVMAYPLNDMQMERIVKLALGKRVLEATAATAGRDPPGATTSVDRTIDGPQAEPEVMSDDGSQSHRTESTEPEEPPSASRTARPTSPRSEEVAAGKRSEASASRQQSDSPPNATTAAIPNGKRRRRAAQKAARAAAKTGGETSVANGE